MATRHADVWFWSETVILLWLAMVLLLFLTSRNAY